MIFLPRALCVSTFPSQSSEDTSYTLPYQLLHQCRDISALTQGKLRRVAGTTSLLDRCVKRSNVAYILTLVFLLVLSNWLDYQLSSQVRWDAN